ncbi:MAG TPA: AgmX/PglI C-terminal domain-containing protein [Candidatus Binatia bacterium]|nr:AgmX/PglI C-terminal domain-containing protein [Candidatus Binatia bacterium]
MADTPKSGDGLATVERLLHEQRYDEALAALAKLIDENPSNRQIRIYRLLAVRIILLRQNLISQTGKPPYAMAQESFWQAAKALQIFVIPYVTHRLRSIRESIRGQLPGDILRRAALMTTAVGVLMTPTTFYLAGSLGVAHQRISEVQKEPPQLPVRGDVLRGDVLIDASESVPAAPSLQIDEQRLYHLVANQVSNVRSVYGQWIEKNRNLMGSLLLKLTVDSSGKVTRVDDLGSSLTDANFANVIMKEARKWKFPENTAEAAEIIIPLLLVPEGMDPALVEIWQRMPKSIKREQKTTSTLHGLSPTLESEAGTADTKPKSVSDSKPNARNQAASKRSEKARFGREVETTYTTKHSLALREEPRFAAASLQQIDGGTPISILATDGDWLKVKMPHSSAIGYLRKEFVIPANTIR